jgi:sulfonate transport system ATP-binding protein
MQELIVSLWQEHGFTVLLVTHDVSEAVAMADRVLLIEEKKIGLDLNVDIPRPRRTGSAKLAELEAEVLDRVMKRGKSERRRVYLVMVNPGPRFARPGYQIAHVAR